MDELTDSGSEKGDFGFQENVETSQRLSIELEALYIPHDESYKHFSKMAPDSFIMEDVKKFEETNGIFGIRLWPNGILPFEFDDAIQDNVKQQDLIYDAMEEWEMKTCLKFEPFTPSIAKELGHNQRMRLLTDQRSCYSRIGKVSKWTIPQPVSLSTHSDDNCWTPRVILHELGHVIGLIHTHQRSDRDEFVTVYKKNVQDGKYDTNFAKYEDNVNATTTPYDFLSIMHYGKNLDGKIINGRKQITMVPKLKHKCYGRLMGRARHLSHYDHQLVNTMYGCNKGCDGTKCGKDCYATRSGENLDCHCVCLDDSNNDCAGGSCFGGDLFSDCSTLVKNDPRWTCVTYEPLKGDCCESCKSVDPDCPADGNSKCAEMAARSPGFCSSPINKRVCCKSCEGI